MNKVHKLNGFVYVTSDEEIKDGDLYIADKYIWQCGHTKLIDKINGDKSIKIVLTNNPDLKEIQQLTKEEVDYCNSVDEVEVRKEKYSERFDNDKSAIGNPDTWCYRYKLIIPTQEEASKETFDEALDLYSNDEKNKKLPQEEIDLKIAKWQAKQMYTEVLDQFINEIKSEFSDQNWDYLEFIKERVIKKQKQ